MQTIADVQPQMDAIATYLGRTFPTASIERYHDSGRDVLGFKFTAASHCNVEFQTEFLKSLPRDESGVAMELHLRHVGAEIIETKREQRLIFTTTGTSREPTA
ncbi:MAG: hypothetical protein ACREM8_09140 [Vulcanimicrobiaceae bacterium]